MILETIVFTALPTARKGNELFASVLISPQLGGDESNPKRLPLSRYRDFAGGQWARIVAAIEWQLVLRWSVDDSEEDSLPAERISVAPDPDLFATIFPADMPVDPFTYTDYAAAPVVSYPAARLARDLNRLQEAVAQQAPYERPPIESMVTRAGDFTKAPMDPFVLYGDRREKLDLGIDQVLATTGVLTTPEGATSEGTARSIAMLHRMLRPNVLSDSPAKRTWPDLDFHRVLSLLQSHPQLLRRLGLLVDLRVPITRIRRQQGTPRVYALIDWPPPYDPDVAGLDITTSFPRVRTRLAADYFRPLPRAAGLTDAGFANLSSAVAITSTIESEILGTEAEATGTARLMRHEPRLETYSTPQKRGIPARHSAGVEFVRPDEAARWRERMGVASRLRRALATGDDVLLDAEDVVMGYRIDIRRAGDTAWRSLHRRQGTLTPYAGVRAQSPIALGADEGWSEQAATRDDGDLVQGRPVIKMRETLAMWKGWSLSLPAPGDSLDSEDRPTGPITAEDAPDLIASMHATIDYAAPDDGARLPALRFSTRDYEARMRWVDLGGNSLEPDAAGGSILKFPYLRHDPVPSPALYMTAPPVWSETVDVMVLRTANDRRYDLMTAERWIAPPKSAAFFCLMHGMFDDANGRPRADAFATIAGRESASIDVEIDPAGNTPYVVRDPGAVPYLPDPLAKGLLVRGAPQRRGAFTGEVALSYRGRWPNVEVASIKADGARPSGVDVQGEQVIVGLAPGRVAHLRLSHSLTPSGLALMDLWRRISGSANEVEARKGANWLLTPDRVLVVVHAVQRPVLAPAFIPVRVGAANRVWRAQREAGESDAALSGFLTLDQPSTESVDIVGVRTYAVDEGPGTAPPRVVVRSDMGVLGTSPVIDPAPGGGEADVRLAVRAPFPDTRREQVSLMAIAKSRYAEYFRRTVTASAQTAVISLNAGQPIVAGSVRVGYRYFGADLRPIDGKAQETAYIVDADAGTLRLDPDAPAEDAIPTSAFLTISFIPGPITRASTDASVAGDRRGANLTVPSSARPLAPQAEWILPAFGWSARNRTSTRTGRALRIYLARPWFTSGIGEELAIVLQPANADVNAARDALVTQWGLDPITTGGTLPRSHYPLAPHFTNAALAARGVRMAEMDADVDIVRYRIGGHNAQGEVSGYDPDRDMYFVDIEMNPGTAYRPFVRLALARYQPFSVDGLHLSPISLVDVVQLEPDRTASVALFGSVARQSASFTLTGRSYAANEMGPGPGKAVAILERYDGPTGPKADPTLSAAWTQLQTVTLTGSIAGTQATWTGRMTVPGTRPAGRYRIVFEQFELIRTDGTSTPWRQVRDKDGKFGERLVHQDIIGI